MVENEHETSPPLNTPDATVPVRLEEPWTHRIAKQAAGTAMMTAIGVAAGAAYGTLKKNGVKTSATIGGFVGASSSLGFGRAIYDGLFQRCHEKQSHTDRIVRSRSSGDSGPNR